MMPYGSEVLYLYSGTKVRISERNSKQKGLFVLFPNERTYGRSPKCLISEWKSNQKSFLLYFLTRDLLGTDMVWTITFVYQKMTSRKRLSVLKLWGENLSIFWSAWKERDWSPQTASVSVSESIFIVLFWYYFLLICRKNRYGQNNFYDVKSKLILSAKGEF